MASLFFFGLWFFFWLLFCCSQLVTFFTFLFQFSPPSRIFTVLSHVPALMTMPVDVRMGTLPLGATAAATAFAAKLAIARQGERVQ